MKDDNNLITGIAIDQYIDLQHDNPEINMEFEPADEVAETPDYPRDQEDQDPSELVREVSDDDSDALS